MSIADRPASENRVVTYTDWEGYLKFLDAVGEGHTRVTYDRGKLELMSPGRKHEKRKSAYRALLEALMNHKRVVYENGGCMTFRRQDLDRGLEPDECCWIQHVQAVSGGEEYDPLAQPPPDLVLEVDVSSSSIDRVDIYRAMRVPEVWVCSREGQLSVRRLMPDGSCETLEYSPTFPQVPLQRFEHFYREACEATISQAVWAFQAWLQEALPQGDGLSG